MSLSSDYNYYFSCTKREIWEIYVRHLFWHGLFGRIRFPVWSGWRRRERVRGKVNISLGLLLRYCRYFYCVYFYLTDVRHLYFFKVTHVRIIRVHYPLYGYAYAVFSPYQQTTSCWRFQAYNCIYRCIFLYVRFWSPASEKSSRSVRIKICRTIKLSWTHDIGWPSGIPIVSCIHAFIL